MGHKWLERGSYSLSLSIPYRYQMGLLAWLFLVSLLLLLLVPTIESFAPEQRCRRPLFLPPLSPTQIFQSQIATTTGTNDSATKTSSLPCHQEVTVVLPGSSFRDTLPGELSVASCNLLAPTYHCLTITDVEQRNPFALQDRIQRVPLAFDMIKQTNADFLLLQEVEGGPLYESQLRENLARPITTASDRGTLPGYDSYLWVPLLPNRPDHAVGLCIAWRSAKHRLVTSYSYKRGMIGQFSEVVPTMTTDATMTTETTAPSQGTFAIANVHLPARPSQILGRLVTMSRTIQNLALHDVPERQSPLDGLLMIGGDWNCDQHSITARLLLDGRVNYGNVRDRNYKATISKAVASRMKHGYRFHDIYHYPLQHSFATLRQTYAPVTVSLHGRGPGCMDHLFYTQQRQGSSRRSMQDLQNKEVGGQSTSTFDSTGSVVVNPRTMSKRKSRREQAFRSRRTTSSTRNRKDNNAMVNGPTEYVRIESVLATIAGSQDTERLAIINQGLPNVEAGFPSDHIPVGALFVPTLSSSTSTIGNSKDSFNPLPSPTIGDEESLLSITQNERNNNINQNNHDRKNELTEGTHDRNGSAGISSSVRRRRDLGSQSISIRRRHNMVLRVVAEWIEQNGAWEIFRDLPLYKNPWTYTAPGLTKKSRAPDIIGRIHDRLVVVEVTVVAPTKVESIAVQKQDKYSDLPKILPRCPTIQEAQLMVEVPMILVLDENGGIPEMTQHTILHLANLLHPNDPNRAQEEAQLCTNRLQSIF